MVSLVPGICAYAATFAVWRYLPAWLALPLTPAVLAFVFLLVLAALRLPAPRPGDYARMPFLLRWQLAREAAARRCGLYYLVQAFYTTRFLYLRALGAKTHFSTNCSLDLSLRGVSLLSVGPRATLALFCRVHTFREHGGGVHIAPVVIGEGAFIGKSAQVGPGCVVEDGAFIGMMNALDDGEHVAAKERLPDYTRGCP